METLSEVLEEQLKDLYNAENQLLKALPKMAKRASSEELKDAFLTHAEETRVHVERLQQVAELLGVKPTGKVCAAMKGLVEEGQEVIEEDGDGPAIDAALVAAAQRVEHYEMAAYGTVRTLAELLGHQEAVELFEQTLGEEKATDAKLTQVVEQSIYPGAPKNEGDVMEGEEEDEESGRGSRGGRGGARKGTSRGGSKGGSKSGSKGGSRGGSSGRGSSGNRRPPSPAAASKGGRKSSGRRGGRSR